MKFSLDCFVRDVGGVRDLDVNCVHATRGNQGRVEGMRSIFGLRTRHRSGTRWPRCGSGHGSIGRHLLLGPELPEGL